MRHCAVQHFMFRHVTAPHYKSQQNLLNDDVSGTAGAAKLVNTFTSSLFALGHYIVVALTF